MTQLETQYNYAWNSIDSLDVAIRIMQLGLAIRGTLVQFDYLIILCDAIRQ